MQRANRWGCVNKRLTACDIAAVPPFSTCYTRYNMILTCPQCATRYKTDAAKFPAEGRNVRCAKCGNVWHQIREPDETDNPAPIPQPVPEPEQPVAEEVVRSEPVPVIREPVRPTGFTPETVEDVPAPVIERAAKPSRLGMLAGWLLFLIVLLGIAAALFFFRQQIVSLWPQSASLYAAIGLDANARGLSFEDVSYVKGKEGEQIVLIINGKLRNVTGHELAVPQLRVGLSDSGAREVYHWTFSPDAVTLKPGQVLPFRTRLTSPPPAAVGIEVRFAKEGE